MRLTTWIVIPTALYLAWVVHPALADTSSNLERYRDKFERLVIRHERTAVKLERQFRDLAKRYRQWYSAADFNKDHLTDEKDLAFLKYCLDAKRIGSPGICVLADLDGSGSLDVTDLAIFASLLDQSNPVTALFDDPGHP